jgi:hypothetical protein
MSWRFLLFSILACAISYGSCGLLTTSIGLEGSLTASINEHGTLSFLQDGFSIEEGRRVPTFSKVSKEIRLGGAGQVRTLSSLVHREAKDGYFAVVDSRGSLRLSMGDGRAIPVNLPESAHASSAMLFHPAVRDYQKHIVAIRGFQEDPTAPLGSVISEQTNAIIDTVPDYLYTMAGNRIFRATILRHSLHSLKVNIQKELIRGRLIRVREKASLPGQGASPKNR